MPMPLNEREPQSEHPEEKYQDPRFSLDFILGFASFPANALKVKHAWVFQ